MLLCTGGRELAHGGENDMEFEAEGNRKNQLMALLMTVAVVGGTIAYAMMA